MFQHCLRSILALFIFAAVLPAQVPEGQTPEALLKSVSSLRGWTAGKSATFNESNIDTLDPVIASSLRTYGMNGVTVQAWQGPLGAVHATLFELTDASAAYGFFTVRRRREGVTSPGSSVGAESFQAGNTRYFWQASFVVRLEGDAPAMDAVAKTLSEKILGHSQRPPVSNHLPSANLIAGTEEYLLDAGDLQKDLQKDIQKTDGVDPLALGFDVSAEAAIADYQLNGKTIHLLLVLYPTQQIAKKYADQLNAATPDFAASRKRIGPLLAIILGTSDTSAIQSLMDQIHYGSRVTWNEPQPGLGLGPVIVTVFTFIGILLGLCVVVGVGLGGFRVLMKTFYPNRVFDRPEDVGIIQLKLDQELIRKELSK